MNNCTYTPPNWLFIDFLKANDVKAGRVELVKAAAGLAERGVLAARAKPSSDRQSTTLTQKQQPVRA